MKNYYPIIKLSNLPSGRGTKITVKNKEIAVFRQGDKIIAVQNQCPHQNADLALGYIKDNKLYCYLHHWAFDITNGAYAFNEALRLKMYDIKIDDDQVFIGLEE